MHGLLLYDNIWKSQGGKNTKYWKSCPNEVHSKKYSFDIFMVGNSWSMIFTSYPNDLGIKEKLLILTHTMYILLLLQI